MELLSLLATSGCRDDSEGRGVDWENVKQKGHRLTSFLMKKTLRSFLSSGLGLEL